MENLGQILKHSASIIAMVASTYTASSKDGGWTNPLESCEPIEFNFETGPYQATPPLFDDESSCFHIKTDEEGQILIPADEGGMCIADLNPDTLKDPVVSNINEAEPLEPVSISAPANAIIVRRNPNEDNCLGTFFELGFGVEIDLVDNPLPPRQEFIPPLNDTGEI